MKVVTVHAAKTNLSRLIEQACAGEEIVIGRGREPVDHDLITPTFKVKRNRIEDRFAKSCERRAGQRKPVVWND